MPAVLLGSFSFITGLGTDTHMEKEVNGKGAQRQREE